MILVVEDEPEFQAQISKWITRACRSLSSLSTPFDISSQLRIVLTQEDIKMWVERCAALDDPLLLIIDLEIDMQGIGPTTVYSITQTLWRDTSPYTTQVPIIVYTGGYAMENPAPRDRGWRVAKNPPAGKTASEQMMEPLTKALEAVLATWHKL